MRLNINIIFTSRTLPTTADDDPRSKKETVNEPNKSRVVLGLQDFKFSRGSIHKIRYNCEEILEILILFNSSNFKNINCSV